MDKVLYRSAPRLSILVFTSFGPIFFGLSSWMTWLGYKGESLYIVLILGALFSIVSIWSFCLFITIRIVKLLKDSIEFSFLLLPIRHTYPLTDVKSTFQRAKNIETANGFLTPLTFTYITTGFELADKTIIKMNSIGSLDFAQLQKCFNKLTRGDGHYIAPKKRFVC